MNAPVAAAHVKGASRPRAPAAGPSSGDARGLGTTRGTRPARTQRPLRVLVVGPLPPPAHGGSVATQYVLHAPLGARLRLCHVDTTDRRDLGNVGRVDVRNVWLALRHGVAFLRTLAAARPDVVLVPIAQVRAGFLRDCLFLLPALLARRALVVHVHAGGFRTFHDTTDPLTRALVRFTMKRARRAIVLGEALRESVRGLIPDARVAVVPNGIADPFDGGLPPRTARRTCTVLYLGTLMQAKGFLDVLAAARMLASEDLRFILAGSFFRPEDKRRARELLQGSTASVEFTGAVDDETKAALLREADVFVFPTRYENEAHPYVVLEAMAAGLPVVTTKRGAIAETVVDGEAGVLVPEGDVAALAGAIRQLAEDPARRRRMGDAARARFERAYRLERWSDALEAVLRAAAAP